MNTKKYLIFAACAGMLGACATAVPKELADARQAYARASAGPAAQVAPAELHVAHDAMVRAESSFLADPESYRTRDLSYIGQRKSEIAEATASIALEQKSQVRSKSEFQTTQGKIIASTKEDLTLTRSALAESERIGEASAERLYDAQDARSAADKRTTEAQAGRTAAEQQIVVEQAARAAAEQRAAAAQLALAKLAAVKREPRGVVITLSGGVLFATNKFALLGTAMTKLDQIALALKEQDPSKRMIVEGHTDSQGSDAINQPLSFNRATAVRDYLVSRGVATEKISAIGMGSSKPITDNTSPENRANNRRVEIVIQTEAHTSNP